MAESTDPADRPALDESTLADVVRGEWSRLVATLVSDLGDLTLAEDAAQDAAEQALVQWRTELPDRPLAWLIVVARRRAIDAMRRDAVGRDKNDLAARLDERDRHQALTLDEHLDQTIMRDEQLRLIFACCHPALNTEAQVGLTLRSIGGLTTAEIARAFVVPEPTIAQRLVRAKKKIRTAAIPFTIPPDDELLGRTDIVRSVLYLIFNEGYDASSGDEHIRTGLCDEAVRLARLLAELTPDDPESLGLLALFLLTHARRDARVDRGGALVLLEDQDRTRWDGAMVERGLDVLDRATRLERPGPLQIQAAIAALHDEAGDAAATDWEQIELLYRRLRMMTPTPVVALNHAAAVAMVDGPAAGLRLLDDPLLADRLDRYPHFHAARGRLFADVGDRTRSTVAFERALSLTESGTEQRFLRARLDALNDSAH